MSFQELKEQSADELKQLLHETKRELWKVKFANQAGQLEDTSKIGKLRQKVARINTLASQRLEESEIEENGTGEANG